MVNRIEEILGKLKELTLIEANDLINKMEEVFGIDLSVNNNIPTAKIDNNTKIEEIIEKTSFNLILEEVPSDKKIAILKVIRTLTSLGLKEAKDLVEGAPKQLKAGVSKKDADDINIDNQADGFILKYNATTDKYVSSEPSVTSLRLLMDGTDSFSTNTGDHIELSGTDSSSTNAGDEIVLEDGVNGSRDFEYAVLQELSSSIIPSKNGVFDLGSPTKRFHLTRCGIIPDCIRWNRGILWLVPLDLPRLLDKEAQLLLIGFAPVIVCLDYSSRLLDPCGYQAPRAHLWQVFRVCP